ncbi:RluA family pseudouridine synthase [Lacticaseibacillus sp. N501-2]|uniref:RluA family pseudouridine synthase n=1 Tax=Lacticaseibacillus salsurae TaxID=3367729 RepID=UPI0038B26D78
MRFTFTITASRDTTIRVVLADFGVSHRLLKKLFDAHLVWVDQHPALHNREVKKGALVRFDLPDDGTVALSAHPIEIVQELANWLIVNKPAGLASVPGPSSPDDSLLNRVAGWLHQQGFTHPQPAIITRLDRDTTGLVLVAKHPFAQGRLDALGVNGQLSKHYLAVVSGVLPPTGRIDRPLALAADGIHREVNASGQSAITEYDVLTQGAQAALVRVHLLTGRTHQIRAHFAAIGHPVVGDELYGGDLRQFDHQLLQASELEFTDPFTSQAVHAQLPLPEAWEVAIKKVGK